LRITIKHFYRVEEKKGQTQNSTPTMTYKEAIIEAISELKDRTGSSMMAIKKVMMTKIPKDKKWQNTLFLQTLKKCVADGTLVQVKSSYKLSAEYKKKAAAPAKKKTTVVKKKATTTKKTVKKTTATKKKATTAKKVTSPKKKTTVVKKVKTATTKKVTTAKPKKAATAKTAAPKEKNAAPVKAKVRSNRSELPSQ
jgi:histone H1/5